MKQDCDSARSWLAEQGCVHPSPSFEENARHAAHVAACVDCGDVLARYGRWSETCAEELTYAPPQRAESDFVSTAASWADEALEPPVMTAFHEGLAYRPSEVREGAFLAAVAAQQDTPRRVRRSWGRPLLAGGALAAAVVLIALVWDPAPHREERTAVGDTAGISVVRHTGLVAVDEAPLPSKGRSMLRPGNVVSTGSGAHLDMGSEASAVVSLAPESVLKIQAWDNRSTQLRLERGTITARVAHREAGKPFEIFTPNARISVMGTEFSVTYGPEGDTVVEGMSGKVRVEERDGRLVGFVTAGTKLKVARKTRAGLTELDVQQASQAVPSGDHDKSVQENSRLALAHLNPAMASKAKARSASLGAVAETKHKPRKAQPGARGSRLRSAKAPVPSMEKATAVENSRQAAEGRPSDGNESGEEARASEPTTEHVSDQATTGDNSAENAQQTQGGGLKQARSLLGHGRVDEAIAVLQNLAAGDWRRDALLGDAYQLNQRFSEARDAYSSALNTLSNPPAALFVDLARLQEKRLKDRTGAAKTWQHYLKVHPRGAAVPRAHFAISEVALAKGETARAERHLRALHDGYPKSRQADPALALLGAMLLEQERWDEAETLFARRLGTGRSAGEETALVGMIRVRIAQGAVDEARQLLRRYRRTFVKGQRAGEVARLEKAIDQP